MADIKWIKLTTNIHEDETMRLIDAMPERDTIHYLWIRLLVQAGKTNANGLIYFKENIPYTDEMLSTLFSRPLDSIRLAFKVLSDFQMIEIDENNIIKIMNWDKHQNVEGMDRVRDQNRKRVQNHREKKKQLEAAIKESEEIRAENEEISSGNQEINFGSEDNSYEIQEISTGIEETSAEIEEPGIEAIGNDYKIEEAITETEDNDYNIIKNSSNVTQDKSNVTVTEQNKRETKNKKEIKNENKKEREIENRTKNENMKEIENGIKNENRKDREKENRETRVSHQGKNLGSLLKTSLSQSNSDFNANSNVNSKTNLNANLNLALQSSSDTDTNGLNAEFNKNLEDINTKCAELIKYAETITGIPNVLNFGGLKLAIGMHGQKVVKMAIDVALKANKPNMTYIDGILKNWMREGYPDDRGRKKNVNRSFGKNSEQDKNEFAGFKPKKPRSLTEEQRKKAERTLI